MRVIIFTSKPPRAVVHFLSRVCREVPEVSVCGVLYQLPRPGGAFREDAAARLSGGLVLWLDKLGSSILRFMHACPGEPNGRTRFDLGDLSRWCESTVCSLLVASDLRALESLEFVRELNPDLGIVYGPEDAVPELFSRPHDGSIVLRRSGVLDCGNTALPGQEGLMPGEQQVRLSVHRFETISENGVIETAVIRVGAYDTLTSLALKTNLVGNDLLIRATARCARGEMKERRPARPAEGALAPALDPRACYTRQIVPLRLPYRPPRSRPLWNMLLRTLLSSPFVVLRNWFRRWRGSAPVIILFHHLVTDRPHHLGIPTELFFRHVEFIKRHYRVSSLGEAIEALQAKRVKVPTVVLTFDDGYQENFINLRAVAEETGITATLFICTEHASRQREFDHDRKRQQHNFPPLTWEQIRFLSRNGFEIGSHTRSHFDCGSTDVAVLRHEIEGSKEDLEKQLGHQVVFFAFPWGQPANMSQQAVQLAEATYAYIFSAHGGVNLPSRKRAPQRLLRCDHSNDLWELELQLQSVLEW